MISLNRTMFYVLLFFCVPITLLAQVEIKGTVPYIKNTTIELIRYRDLLTETEAVIFSDTLNEKGEFSLAFELPAPEYVMIRSSYYSSGLYVVPGAKYKVELLPKDSDQVLTLGKQVEVGMRILQPEKDSINHGIMEVNAVIDSFFQKNYQAFVIKAAKPAVDKFKPAVTKRFSSYPYLVRNYLKYALAPVDEAVFRTRADLFKYYFAGPVDYRNKEYMDYFHQFFLKHLQALMLKHEEDFNKALNTNRSFNDLVKLVQLKDTLVKNDTLARLVVLKGLAELYYLPQSNQLNIQILLTTAKGLQSEPVSTMAANLLDLLTGLQQGSIAFFPAVADLNGKAIEKKNLKGKHVYLFFWARWCEPCLQELKFLSSFHEKYKRKVQVIAVNIDDDPKGLKEYVVRQKFDWINIHDSMNQFRNAYRVKAVPTAFLIDEDGDLLQSPAIMPSENLKGFFENILRKK